MAKQLSLKEHDELLTLIESKKLVSSKLIKLLSQHFNLRVMFHIPTLKDDV